SRPKRCRVKRLRTVEGSWQVHFPLEHRELLPRCILFRRRSLSHPKDKLPQLAALAIQLFFLSRGNFVIEFRFFFSFFGLSHLPVDLREPQVRFIGQWRELNRLLQRFHGLRQFAFFGLQQAELQVRVAIARVERNGFLEFGLPCGKIRAALVPFFQRRRIEIVRPRVVRPQLRVPFERRHPFHGLALGHFLHSS